MRKKKKLTLKRILKIGFGIVIFFTLPTLLLFGFLYLKYNEPLPTGMQGEQADALATKMLTALDYNKYKATDYIEFTFKKRHHFKWYKTENTCEVYWKNYKVHLDFNDPTKNEAFVNNTKIKDKQAKEAIEKAIDLFNNDTFWLVAPYKVFDPGTERRIVKTEDNNEALLVTYTNGGSTPGDSYLWHLDENGKPKSFQMWVSILPIQGLEATWNAWTTTDTGAQLPTFHKLMILGIEIEGIKTTPEEGVTYYYPNRELYNTGNRESVELDSLKNFKDLLKHLNALCLGGKSSIVSVKNDSINFKLKPYFDCSNTLKCYFTNNIIQIKNSTIKHPSIYDTSIDSLPKYLDEIGVYRGKNYRPNRNKISIFISQDSLNEISSLKHILLKVTTDFNELNKKHEDSLSLHIEFQEFLPSDVPPPPPPPPPKV
ncbi:hypothetical protein [Lacinutrix salivirga]